jgi:protein-tyrosine phosphatase
MAIDRHLNWGDCYNLRDLGALPAAGGRWTRWSAIVRGDAPDRLTAAGWSSLWAYGIRTVIDLRNEHEHGCDAAQRPAGLVTVHVPLDDLDDAEFWDRWKRLDCTPLYYREFLERFPERTAGVIAAVADAGPGGVLIHCAGGRDRTGLVTPLLLALVGVSADDIAADYTLSAARLAPAWADLGVGDQDAKISALLARENTTAREAILATLASVDIAAYLRRIGLSDPQLAAIRDRLLGPA